MCFIALDNLIYDTNATSTSEFQANFLKRWSLQAFDEGTRGAEIVYSFIWPRPKVKPETIARLICHIYVTHMPARGLPELHENLQDLYEFYNEPIAHEQTFLPQSAIIKAKIDATVVRPDFSVEYD